MYDNSNRVPGLYTTAAFIVKGVTQRRGSVKNLVYNSTHPNIKALYSIVDYTVKKGPVINQILKKIKLFEKEPPFNYWLAKVLVGQVLRGRAIKGNSVPVKTILAHKQTIRAHSNDKHTLSQLEEVKPVYKPRYVRVNTLKKSVTEVLEELKVEGWILKPYTDVENYQGFLDTVASLNEREFIVDLHIPYILIFPPETTFHSHPLHKSGVIFSQDKASCLPVHLLNPTPGSTVLDMCAAPGMKTTQVACIIQDKGRVYAIEKAEKRYELLNQMVEKSGATCIKTINGDTLTLTENELTGVEYILVDPSCSGSGIVNRTEAGQQKGDEHHNRLRSLANLQIMLLRHAFIRYSKAKRIVYSTCSVYQEENEDVVRRVLETCTNFKLVPAGPLVNNKWLSYGSSEFGNIGNYCLYAKPDIDYTGGFFVAVFERLEPGETNPFLKLDAFPLPEPTRPNIFSGGNRFIKNSFNSPYKKKYQAEKKHVGHEAHIKNNDTNKEQIKNPDSNKEQIENTDTNKEQIENTDTNEEQQEYNEDLIQEDEVKKDDPVEEESEIKIEKNEEEDNADVTEKEAEVINGTKKQGKKRRLKKKRQLSIQNGDQTENTDTIEEQQGENEHVIQKKKMKKDEGIAKKTKTNKKPLKGKANGNMNSKKTKLKKNKKEKLNGKNVWKKTVI